MFLFIKAYAEGWVTINGNHVYIGAKGTITKGPAKLIGSTIDSLKGTKMTAKKKAELQKKYAEKSKSKSSGTKEDGSKTSNTDWEKWEDPLKGSSAVTERLKNLSDKELKKVHDESFSKATVDATDKFTSDAAQHACGISLFADKEARRRGLDFSSNAKDNARAGITKKESSQPQKLGSQNSTPKYPTGIETTAQKRAYTKAINSGKSTSEATKIAKNAGASNTTPKYAVAGFSKSQNAQLNKYISQGIDADVASDLVLSKSGHSIFGRGKRGGFM